MALSPAALVCAAAALGAAFCLWALWRRLRQPVPRGTIVYSDADGRGRPLVSPHRPLSGKPDFVVRLRGGATVPVEYKSYRYGSQPQHSDLVQLGAYLLLLEDLHGRRPPYGILRYRDRSLRIPYTDALRAEVLRVLASLVDGSIEVPVGVGEPALCRACPFISICEDARG